MQKTLISILIVFTSLVTTPVFAENWHGCSRRHSSTAAEGWLYGQSQLLRAQGALGLMAQDIEAARLENELRRAEVYWEKKAIHRANTQDNSSFLERESRR